MKKVLYVFLLFFSFSTFAQTATVDKNKVALGEAFLLTISLSNKPSQKPDLSPLDKDFKVISVYNSFNTQSINGYLTQTIEFSITLMAKTEGKLLIPSITIDGLKTKPIAIEVLPQSELEKTTQKQIEFKGALEKKSAYVQEEIGYSLYLIDDGGLEVSAPVFTNTDDFVIKSLREPTVSAITKDGKRLRQIRFDYALFAQSSGELSIPSFEVQGYLLEEDNNINNPFVGGFFQGMGIGLNVKKTPVALRVNPQKIIINPAPSNWQGWWLPAQAVELKDEFLTQNFNTEEPIKRKITLSAKGVMNTQLPEFEFDEIKGIKQYPGKPQSQNFVKGGEVVSIKEVVHTYVPQTSGEVVLPEITINWFDVNDKMAKVATLPKEVIFVSSPVGNGLDHSAQQVLPAGNAPNPSSPLEVGTTASNTPPLSSPLEVGTSAKQGMRGINIITIFASLMFGIIIGYLITSPKKANLKKAVISSKTNKELEKNLLLWGQQKFANIYNIKDIANKINNKDFSNQVELLTQAIYGNNNSFTKTDFIKIFKSVANKKKASKEASILPSLYK